MDYLLIINRVSQFMKLRNKCFQFSNHASVLKYTIADIHDTIEADRYCRQPETYD